MAVTTHRVAREDPAQRMIEQQRDPQYHQEARSNPEYRASEQQARSMRRQ